MTGVGLDTENLLLRLAPDAVIAGKILDESNEPVRQATVTLYFEDHRSGVDQIRQSRSAQTNDLGDTNLRRFGPALISYPRARNRGTRFILIRNRELRSRESRNLFNKWKLSRRWIVPLMSLIR